jgi:hypothetical protein
MAFDPPILEGIVLGCLASIWAFIIYMFSGDPSDRKIFCLFSIGASVACVVLFSQVPDWRLIWIRWSQQDFCALPGHSALRYRFIDAAAFAFLSPVFAYLGFRLARSFIAKVMAMCLLLVCAIVVALVIQGFFWHTDW